jgi:hypothetical protein
MIDVLVGERQLTDRLKCHAQLLQLHLKPNGNVGDDSRHKCDAVRTIELITDSRIPQQITSGITDEVARIDQFLANTGIGTVIGEHIHIAHIDSAAVQRVDLHAGFWCCARGRQPRDREGNTEEKDAKRPGRYAAGPRLRDMNDHAVKIA